METKKIVILVESLAAQAATAKPSDALHLSQAALNLAHVAATLHNMHNMK